MMLSFLVAADEQNVIGKANQLPWHLPADLKFFKNLTWGMPVLMGRKTFESIGKPLAGRKNIVITRNRDWQHEGIQTVHSVEEAKKVAAAISAKELIVIGGAEIFNSLLPEAGCIYLTRVHHKFEGDAFFPALNTQEWLLINEHNHPADDKNAYPLTFQRWERTGAKAA